MNKICVYVTTMHDVADAARKARTMAAVIGFSAEQSYHIAMAAAELAANLFIHAGGGVFVVSLLTHSGTAGYAGLELVATDNGPGIADVELAWQGGTGGDGVPCRGLSCVQRLMDELEIDSRPGEGSVVRACKWL
ncbi:MAG TPA: ATP-binding protein [Gallionella sp.]|nr:ATP-binding protein [Gallionella sp.]